MESHSKTPWRVSDTVRDSGHVKISGQRGLIATVGNGELSTDRFASDAVLIVDAVNHYFSIQDIDVSHTVKTLRNPGPDVKQYRNFLSEVADMIERLAGLRPPS